MLHINGNGLGVGTNVRQMKVDLRAESVFCGGRAAEDAYSS